MKTIRLPAGCDFVRFDTDVGRLISIAEYPDETMLDARMKHDWRIGAALLDAVKQGRLCVRDCQTRFPLKPDAPSLDVLSSLVSVNDLREFVADLGYDVQVEHETEISVPQQQKMLQAGPAAHDEPGQAAPSTRLRTRRDLMTPVIESAQRQCKDPYDAAEVWNVLVRMCKGGHGPMFGVTEDGIQWADSEDTVCIFSVKNLGDRLRNWRRKAR